MLGLIRGGLIRSGLVRARWCGLAAGRVLACHRRVVLVRIGVPILLWLLRRHPAAGPWLLVAGLAAVSGGRQGEPAERERGKEHDQHSGPGEEPEPLEELPRARGSAPGGGADWDPRIDGAVLDELCGDRGAGHEPGAPERGQEGEEP